MQKLIEKANILAEALPYINKLAKKTVVIKYGGNAMCGDDITKTIFEDIAMLKIVGVNPVLVHGGGPEIKAMLERLNIKSEFVNGLRVTDKAAMEVVQMVLCGKLNKDITAAINCMGVKAIGLSGKDADLIRVVKKTDAGVDYGYVGDIVSVNTKLLNLLISDEFIPVISTVGADEHGTGYNINADTAAGEIAGAMNAEKLIYLTDVDGLRRDEKDEKSLIHEISKAEVMKMIKEKSITGGMIPKVLSCISALDKGVKRVHIINGKIFHPIMLEIFTDSGIGTMIY